jgi:hypothetical protein
VDQSSFSERVEKCVGELDVKMKKCFAGLVAGSCRRNQWGMPVAKVYLGALSSC